MTRAEIIKHNQNIVREALTSLIEMKYADPLRLMTDQRYAYENITTYIQAANIARKMMNMPALVLYTINDEEE